MNKIGALLPTEDTFLIHVQGDFECVRKEYRQETDEYIVELVRPDADLGFDGRLTFVVPPGEIADKFEVGRSYVVDSAIE